MASATLTLLKTSKVISDPYNATSNPKAIPGAVVEYCIRISNTGSVSAEAMTLTDAVPNNSTYRSGSIVAGGSVTGGTCNTDGVAEDDDNFGDDETDPRGGRFSSGSVTVFFPSVVSGDTTTARFQVIVN